MAQASLMKSPGDLGSGGAPRSSDVVPVVGLSTLSLVQAESP